MAFTLRAMAVIGIAGFMTLTLLPAQAQESGVSDSDTWMHTVNPRSDGKCWVPTDTSRQEHNHGYWGKCPASAKTAATSGSEARAELRPARRHRRSTR